MVFPSKMGCPPVDFSSNSGNDPSDSVNGAPVPESEPS
jgi:hypothetical protein